jgi:hypothetical protein
MGGVFLLFSHVKNAQCSDSYMKKGGQIKMLILTFFLARSWLSQKIIDNVTGLIVTRNHSFLFQRALPASISNHTPSTESNDVKRVTLTK